MALDWSAHAVRLAGISETNFIERFLGELSRLAMAFPGQEPESVFRKCLDLQRRHGGAVKRVLELAATIRITDLVEQTLPTTSLLRMFLANRTADPSLPVFASKAPGHLRDDNDADSYEPDDEFSLWPLRFALSHRGGEPVVTVTNLGEVVGKAAAPAHCLLPQYQEDLRQGRPHEAHRFVEPGNMCPEAGITPNAVAQNVRRCRKKLAEYYHAIEGSAPEGDLLIESAQWNGYRLDPESRIVPIDDNE